MDQPESRNWRDTIKRLAIGELTGGLKLSFRLLMFYSIAPLAAALYAYLKGFDWLAIAIVVTAVAGISVVGISIFWCWRVLPPKKWRDLSETTDLIGFEKINKDSAFMPDKILERDDIKYLWVMGNGCSKWTRLVSYRKAVTKLKEIREAGGQILFLASCPIKLSESDEAAKKKKAGKNAGSLLMLRKFKDETRDLVGKFEIRTYKHTATLRLIILNQDDCIVGHYTEDGIGDSLETPLLIFRRRKEYEWGFGHAFHRLFNHEWNRAKEPTDDEWEKMKELSK